MIAVLVGQARELCLARCPVGIVKGSKGISLNNTEALVASGQVKFDELGCCVEIDKVLRMSFESAIIPLVIYRQG